MEIFSLQNIFKIIYNTQHKEIPIDHSLGYLNIVMIKSGAGIFTCDTAKMNYEKNSMFIIPEKCNAFLSPYTETKYYFLIFTKQIFSNKTTTADHGTWLRMIDYIGNHPKLQNEKQIKENKDLARSWQIVEFIVQEGKVKNKYSSQITVNLINVLLSILGRSLDEEGVNTSTSIPPKEKYIDNVKAYIKTHLHNTSKLQLKTIAAYFNTTKSTLSIKFKKATGQSLHNYIIKQRLDSAKEKLVHTDFTVSQISYQLGFTDESHLTRMFKKYEKMTPKAFKENNETA